MEFIILQQVIIILNVSWKKIIQIIEPGIPNVNVYLILDGVVVNTTVTNSTGGYLFSNVPRGAGYQVHIYIYYFDNV